MDYGLWIMGNGNWKTIKKKKILPQYMVKKCCEINYVCTM